jgi:hypothetical protein
LGYQRYSKYTCYYMAGKSKKMKRRPYTFKLSFTQETLNLKYVSTWKCQKLILDDQMITILMIFWYTIHTILFLLDIKNLKGSLKLLLQYHRLEIENSFELNFGIISEIECLVNWCLYFVQYFKQMRLILLIKLKYLQELEILLSTISLQWCTLSDFCRKILHWLICPQKLW